jgi:hypothetical protein
MIKSVLNTDYIFKHSSGFVCISPREEKHLGDLLENFGTFQNVPPKEEVTACYVTKVKDEYFVSEDYFFFPVNELSNADEPIIGRRKRFLSFKSKPEFAGSRKK